MRHDSRARGSAWASRNQAAPLAAVDLEPWRPTVADVTVIGDETTHGSDLRGSRLSVLETIAPSETVLDPIPEDDDPDVGHRAWRPEIETARRTGNPLWTLCGKLVYIPARRPPKRCQVCMDISRDLRDRKGRD
jgi:hypothetical protein